MKENADDSSTSPSENDRIYFDEKGNPVVVTVEPEDTQSTSPGEISFPEA